MKLFLQIALAFVFSAVAAPAWGVVQEKQLSKDIKLQYTQWDQKGDDDKYELLITDPHLYWLDTSSMAPRLVGEIDHKGTWKLNVDVKGNHAETVSNGVTHVTLNAPDTEGGQVDFTLDGTITKSLVGDLAKIREPLMQIRAGEFSEERLLTILEAIKEASIVAKDLKITSSQGGTEQTVFETANLNYRHTSGVMPEEFNLNAKMTGDYQLAIGNTTLSFPEVGKYDNVQAGKLALPDWRTLAALVHAPLSKGLPNVQADWSSNVTSKVGSSLAKVLLSSKKQGDRSSVQWSVQGNDKMVADWIKSVIAVKKTTAPGDEENGVASTLYNWLTSPQTKPFLSLLPLQSTIDWNGAFDFLTDPTISGEKGNMLFNWLGNDKTGLKITFDGQDTDDKGAQGNLQVVIAGGRSSYDYFVQLYNAFERSLEPVVQKYNVNLETISDETKDKLYKFLLSYADDPKAQEKELKFTVLYTPAGTTIGGKPISQFASDFGALFTSPAPANQRVEEPEPEPAFVP